MDIENQFVEKRKCAKLRRWRIKRKKKKGNGPKTELKFYYCFYFHLYLEHFHVSKHLTTKKKKLKEQLSKEIHSRGHLKYTEHLLWAGAYSWLMNHDALQILLVWHIKFERLSAFWKQTEPTEIILFGLDLTISLKVFYFCTSVQFRIRFKFNFFFSQFGQCLYWTFSQRLFQWLSHCLPLSYNLKNSNINKNRC